MNEVRRRKVLDLVAEGIEKVKKEVERVEHTREEAKHMPLGYELAELKRSVIPAIHTFTKYEILICEIGRELIRTGEKLDEVKGIKELEALLKRLRETIDEFQKQEHEKLKEEMKEMIKELEKQKVV